MSNVDPTNQRSSLGRVGLIAGVVASLIGASVVRDWSQKSLPTNTSTPASGGQAGLASLDSFAMGLLLGGFKGPLVMAMWMNIEGQKTRRDYDDIDTRINLVRLLQPEFDDVHLFQIGNKAYNLSVQLTSLPAKYAAVLEGLDYAAAVNRERPLNINIIAKTGDIYFQKLGESTEQIYYRARVRDDSLAPSPVVQYTVASTDRQAFQDAALRAGIDPSQYAVQQNLDPARISFLIRKSLAERIGEGVESLSPEVVTRPPRSTNIQDPRFRRFAHDPLLDESGNLLAALITPVPGPGALKGPSPDITLDGSPLQFIKEFSPFPQGVSTYALAYNAFKKADAIRQIRGVRAAEFPPRVLSSRGAVALRFWAQEEFNLARRFEAAAAGIPQPIDAEFPEMELRTSDLPLSAAMNPELVRDALHCYDRILQIIPLAQQEYVAHVARFNQDRALFRPHLDWLTALETMITADRDFLLARNATVMQKDMLLARSRANYVKAREMMYRYGLYWFVNEELAKITFPPGLTREDAADRMSAELLPQVYTRTLSGVTELNLPNTSPREIAEFGTYARRCEGRIAQIDRR